MKTINYTALINYLEHEAGLAKIEYQANINSASDAAPYYQGWWNATEHILATLAEHAQEHDK